MDEHTILVILAPVATLIFLGLVAWGVAIFQKWTGIQLTDQQRKIISDAAEAIAAALKLMMVQGKMQASQLDPANPQAQAVLQSHLTPDVMDALNARNETPMDLLHKSVAISARNNQVIVVTEDIIPPDGEHR